MTIQYKILAALLLIAAITASIMGYGHSRYTEGKAEVQKAWDADKVARKIEAEKQAAVTEKTNEDHQDALNKSKKDISTARAERDAALGRLRDLPDLPGGEGMLMAGSGCTAMSSVATDPGRVGIRIEKRIGRCEDSGSEPCYTSREFFEQAIGDALDRKSTREWAAGQGIETVARGVK